MRNLVAKTWALLQESSTSTDVNRVIGDGGTTLEHVIIKEGNKFFYNQHLGEFIEEFSLVEKEGEISQTQGVAFTNNEFRIWDELGISASTLDAERRLEESEKRLTELRLAAWLMRITNTRDKALERSLTRSGKALANRIKRDKVSLDYKLGTDEVEGILNDICGVVKFQEDDIEEKEIKEDYNKIHWNQAEIFWDKAIIKVKRMTSVEAPNLKQINTLKAMYTRLWSYYRKGTIKVVKGVRKQVGGKMISNRHYAELRYMISAYLFSVAKREDNQMFWAEKAERDLNNLSKIKGAKNKPGEKVPEKEISLDEINLDAFPVMHGAIGWSEDQMIEKLDRKYS